MKPSLQNESLSPAQRLAEILAKECPDEALGEVFRQCLTATTVSRSGAVEPDAKTRLEAVRLALAYRHGLPVRREEIISVNMNPDSELGLRERLLASPALRKSLAALLADAEKSDAVDV